MAHEPTRVMQHLVSAGYQRNFAAGGGWITVLDAKTGEVVEKRASVKTNWRLPNFLSAVNLAGDVDDELEKKFAKHERVILNQIRDIQPGLKLTADQKSAVDTLAAIHLVRSVAFRDRHAEVSTRWLATDALDVTSSPELAGRFEVEVGRSPRPGELEKLVAEQARQMAVAPELLPHGVDHGAERLRQLLAKWSIQLIVADQDLPGFVLADHPVLHGQRTHGRFGFASGGPVGEADTVMVPISRHLAASYAPSSLPDVVIRTRNGLDWVNSLLLRAAEREVACHPDDAVAAAALIQNLDMFPADQFDQVIIR